MSRPSASHSSSTPQTPALKTPTRKTPTRKTSARRASPKPKRLSRRALYQKQVDQRHPKPSPTPWLTPHRRKVLGAGGAITLLATATILPTQVSSQAIADSNCEQVITSGAEISRAQLSSLLTIPTSATRETVRQAVSTPYCTLPAISAEESTEVSTAPTLNATAPKTIEREAYPLAFDPEAWVVLNYSAGEYQGYDFVFKP